MVIVIDIWQKLSSVEREITLIVTDFWQLFSQILGETKPGQNRQVSSAALVIIINTEHPFFLNGCPK